ELGRVLGGPGPRHPLNSKLSHRDNSAMTRIAILNDYQGVALGSADWSGVTARAALTVFTDHFPDEDDAIARLQGFEVLCIMRERLPITRRLLASLPDLRCVVTTGAANRAIDLSAADELGVI